MRYNVQLDKKWLAEELGQAMTDKEVKKLQKMDRPQNMKALSDLALAAATRQVDESHFPREFDLG